MRTNADKAALIIAALSLLLGLSLAQNERLYQRVQELENKKGHGYQWNIKVRPSTYWPSHQPPEWWEGQMPIREPLLNQDEVLHRKMKHLYRKVRQ